MADIELIKKHFTYHKDFPTPGILFCDILPVLRDPLAFEALLNHILNHVFTHTTTLLPSTSSGKIDAVVGLDARGFLFGPILALRLGASFVPVRKRGKLPGECVQASYAKEYGQDVFEMQAGALQKGANVLVVDDLIATGGSAKAAGELVAQLGAKTVEYIFVVAIPFLKGAEKLDAPAYALVDMD
ncbi:adenine phosphoribosyltransferase [Tilletia horrida]|uniref:adenine phosphoribosyltransferase n=1 Tax=Tilletia horrida TaxID=155126 RepID=A0AAN6GH44_9BASI|nr:adenine phosphoribosyltransferase [Tilletia horrida]KAK0533712.1 adenine phosphoribosyltransferase [Tilletia horrida]KAK0540672.1 adenine phosphoribosyltransferase [Tilletia horrida]KAK0566098.1 adenine phosphoribosyltransferase [Tilletia horrida]